MKLLYTDYTDEAKLRELSEKHKVPGFNYCLIKNGVAGETRAFGIKNSETMDPVAPDTIFEAASLTKTLFSTIVMRLVDRGIIDLDESMYERAPELCVSDDPKVKKITPRIALSHGTGFPGWGDRPHLPIDFEPGSDYRYSGEGYYWLQFLVDKITGKEFCDHFFDEIIKPLGMEDSYPVWALEMTKKESNKFDKDGVMQELRMEIDDHSSVPEPNAAWSLYTSAQDYAKFMCEVLNNHAGISDKTFKEQTSRQNKATDHVYWGLGWGLCAEDENVIWHWGDNGCYRALTAMDLETKDGICIFTNGFNGGDLCIDLFKILTGDKYWDDVAEFIAHAE